MNELVDYVKKQEFGSVEEAARALGQKIGPIVSVVSEPANARDGFDGMADLIQLPPLPPIKAHSNDNEEE